MQDRKPHILIDVAKGKTFLGGYYLNWLTSYLFAFAIYKLMTTTYLYLIADSNQTVYYVYFNYFQVVLPPLIIIVNLYYAALYYFQFPFIEQYKVNNVAWPWVLDPKGWKRTVFKVLKVYVINQFVFFPIAIQLYLRYFAPDISIENTPSYFRFMWQLMLAITLEDFFFYFSHRLLHQPFFYKRVHKTHHEFFNTINIASVYTHWFEFLVGNVFPMLSIMVILQKELHMITLAGYVFHRVASTNEGHSGYSFPWSPYTLLPFRVDGGFHNYHHLKNIGNYGSGCWVWDHLFGTSAYYEKEMNEVPDRK